MRNRSVCIGLATVLLVCMSLAVGAQNGQTFSNRFDAYTANNVRMQGNGNVQLVLDKSSAGGFGSKTKFLFGTFSAKLKLCPGDSAGTVTTFYMTSSGNTHNEYDFEFLGNLTGHPYILHTNFFCNGVGGREIQYTLWFDPTTDFHTYTVRWNEDIVLFMVDSVVIRSFPNNEANGQPFPNNQPMGIYSSMWDGSQWATEGGAVKLNWASAPFIATYSNFALNGCPVSGASTIQTCQASTYAAPGPAQQTLSRHQINQMKWVKKYHVKYNYCTDRKRYPVPPPECKLTVL